MSSLYQVVSKHSIQKNARRKISNDTRNHRSKAFLEPMRQSNAPKEPDRRHHDTTTRSDFKVYDPGRGKTENPTNSRRGLSREEEIEHHWNRRKLGDAGCRTRRHHAPTRRSGRRDEILKKIDEILVDLRSSISDLRKKSEGAKEIGETGKETDVSEKDQKGGKKETRPEERSEQATVKEQRKGCSPEETTPAESSPELPENDVATVEVASECNDEECNGEGRSLCYVGNACDGFGKEKKVWADSFPRESEVDPFVISVGQAQYLLLTPTQITENEVSLLSISKAKLTLMDPSFNSMGQTHHFIITPTLFTNSGVLQVEKEIDQKKLMGFDGAQNSEPSMNFKVIENAFGFVGAPKIEVENMKILFPTNIEYRGTNILKRWEVKEVDANIPIIMESPFVHEWDPGGFIRDGLNPSGIRRYVKMNILESANTNAIKVLRIQIHQNLEGFQFVVDDSGGFSAVAAEFLENIVDEYPNTPVMLYAVQGSGSDASLQSRKRTILGELHDAISFSRLSSYCKLIVPVGLPSLNKSKASKFLHVEDGKHYHSSAVYAAAIHSISLPFRMVPVGPTTDASSVSGAVDIHGLVQMVSCTLEVGLFLKILRDKGSTSVLQQFIQVHDLIAKKAWVTEVGFLDTIYGGQAVPTLGQFFKNLLLPQEVISLLIDEHLIQRTGYSTISVAETHHKQWDLGENFSDSCILETSCFKLWDPGGRLVTVCFWYLHLEDKVNFEGAGIDTIASEEGRIGNISMKEVETNFMGTTSTQAHTTIDVTELPTWQWGGSVRNIPLIWRESVIYSLLAFHSGLGWNWDFGWAWEQ